ncbi:hypothetical protein HKD37_15G044151 [Glycine soja]
MKVSDLAIKRRTLLASYFPVATLFKVPSLGIWAPLSCQPSKIDKSVLELYEETTHSLILLSMSHELKLEKLCMTKSICNKFLLKQRLFSLQMKEGMPLKKYFDELNSVMMELRDIDVKMEDEYLAMINVGKDSIILEEVKSSLYSKEL